MRRCFLWLVIVLFPCSAFAQSRTVSGSIEGTAVDMTGGAIAGARVTATHEGSGAEHTTETDEAGQFRFTSVAIGRYRLRLEKSGFGTVAVESFLVSVGQTVVERIEMKPAELVQHVEVKEQPEALDTTASTPSVALGYDRVEEAPAQGRHYLNFVLVAPGVAASGGSSSRSSGPALGGPLTDSGFIFAGLRGRNNSISIDGVDNRDETTGGNRVAIGLEMVQEFRVSGTSVSAEYGGAAGGIVNVVTRSGTNLWHGDATFFFQNERFNARKPEVETPARPRFRRYQPGTSISGPLRKDRTFVAAAIEQEWESDEEWSEVPANRLEAISSTLGTPRFSRAAVKSVLRGLFSSETQGTDFSVKLNHQTGMHGLTARYAFSRGRVLDDVQDVANFTDRSARGSSLTRDHSLVVGWTAVPSAHLAHDVRVQVARRDVDLAPNVRGAMLEIPGVVTLGQSYRLDGSRSEEHFEVVENANVIAGRHQLSFGGDMHRIRLDARLANRFGGIFVFPTLEAFLAGDPDVFLQAFGDPKTELTTWPLGLWLQDRWQAFPGLTLEAGLRYDRQSLPRGFTVASHNLAPRLGLAWRPRPKAPFVVRLGFGLFYDRYPLAFLNDAIQKDGQRGFEQYLAGEAAAQALALGEGGSLPSPISNVPHSVYRADPDFPTTYSRKLAAGIEYSLGKNTTLTVEYNNARGLHLPRIRNFNGRLPPLYQLEQSARSAYQGGTVYVHRRMSRELTFLASYDFGKTWDDASDFDEQPLDPFNLRQDWARSRQHQKHRVTASALFELPVEEWRGAPGWLQESLEKITLAPMLVAGSGRPLNALDSTDSLRTGAYPVSARPFGLARNPFFSPATFSLDCRIMKRFLFKHNRAWVNVGVETFNLTNHANFLRVSPYYAASGSRLAPYNQPVETLNARQVQFLFNVEY